MRTLALVRQFAARLAFLGEMHDVGYGPYSISLAMVDSLLGRRGRPNAIVDEMLACRDWTKGDW
jgi:hypothetical protein